MSESDTDTDETGRISAADTPDGRDWQVVKMDDVGFGKISFERVRYGLTRDEAETKAAKRSEWLAIPMPDRTPSDT